MKLFYGSKTYFEKPIYGEGNPTNDYGLGFYLTDDISMAELWASQFESGGYVLSYNLNCDNLTSIRLLDNDETAILKWITLLVKHRFSYQQRIQYHDVIEWLIKHFDTPIDEYDYIVGYRADDSYFNYSIGFVSGEISLETLARAMKLGKLGLQYVLLTKEAFKNIKFLSSYKVEHNDSYEEFRKKTLDEYHELLRQEDRFHNTFIGELMKKYGK